MIELFFALCSIVVIAVFWRLFLAIGVIALVVIAFAVGAVVFAVQTGTSVLVAVLVAIMCLWLIASAANDLA